MTKPQGLEIRTAHPRDGYMLLVFQGLPKPYLNNRSIQSSYCKANFNTSGSLDLSEKVTKLSE